MARASSRREDSCGGMVKIVHNFATEGGAIGVINLPFPRLPSNSFVRIQMFSGAGQSLVGGNLSLGLVSTADLRGVTAPSGWTTNSQAQLVSTAAGQLKMEITSAPITSGVVYFFVEYFEGDPL